MKIRVNSNVISGLVFLLVSVSLHVMIPYQIVTYETTAVTGRTVPTLLIRGLILCSAILLVQGLFFTEKRTVTVSWEALKNPRFRRGAKPAIYMLMLLLYAKLLPVVGFVVSSLLLSNGILLYFGARKWWYYAIVSANILIAYTVFHQVLRVALP